MKPVDFRLYVITDRHRCRERPLGQVIDEACQAGVRAIQLREKDLAPASLHRLALELKRICETTRTKLFINDRVDLAMAIEAAGVQLTSQSLPPEVVRRFYPRPKLVGVSTHAVEEAQRAADAGADFVLFGPIFHTPTKAQYGPPQGLAMLTRVAKEVRVPVFAVGGITPERARACLDAGAQGVAVISAIMNAKDISMAVQSFKEALGGL